MITLRSAKDLIVTIYKYRGIENKKWSMAKYKYLAFIFFVQLDVPPV